MHIDAMSLRVGDDVCAPVRTQNAVEIPDRGRSKVLGKRGDLRVEGSKD
jgi:hypothetical protein